MRYSQKWVGDRCLVICVRIDGERPHRANGRNLPPSMLPAVPRSKRTVPEPKRVATNPNKSNRRLNRTETRPPLMSRPTARFNELRRELLDDRMKMIDDRAKMIDWWIAATAIFLTLLGVAAAILGYFGFKRLDRIESEAHDNMEASKKHAQEAQHYKEEVQRDLEKVKDEAKRYLKETKVSRDEADSLVKGINAEIAGADPDKTSEVVENVQQNPKSSLIERAVVAALLLQLQNRIEEAIEKWNSIANIVEGTDNELAARAWFSVGYLTATNSVEKSDQETAINAYGKALRLNPDLVEAYLNRGTAKFDLKQYEAALADFEAALHLNPNYAEAYYNRGNAKDALGQYESALADYDAAITRNLDYAGAYLNRGNVKFVLNRYDCGHRGLRCGHHSEPRLCRSL